MRTTRGFARATPGPRRPGRPRQAAGRSHDPRDGGRGLLRRAGGRAGLRATGAPPGRHAPGGGRIARAESVLGARRRRAHGAHPGAASARRPARAARGAPVRERPHGPGPRLHRRVHRRGPAPRPPPPPRPPPLSVLIGRGQALTPHPLLFSLSSFFFLKKKKKKKRTNSV